MHSMVKNMQKHNQIYRYFTCKQTLLLVIFIKVVFSNYGIFNYPHIDRDAIDKVLYKKVIPTVLKKDRPDCTYDYVLHSKDTINTWDVRKNYSEFDAKGVGNGSYSPAHCNPVFSVAILVSYRDRQRQLDAFLPYMHNFLRKQNIHYKIYVIEQQDNKPFNKGLLYNIGARQAIADRFPCLILHDIDLLPLDASNLYACTTQPRHLSASIDKFRFVLPYYNLVGGVLAIRSDQYKQIDGFSNRFLNWGGEDDDIYMRLIEHNFKVVRFPREMSRYTMLYHTQSPMNGNRWKQLAANRRDTLGARAADGIRGARASVSVRKHRPFTLITLYKLLLVAGRQKIFWWRRVALCCGVCALVYAARWAIGVDPQGEEEDILQFVYKNRSAVTEFVRRKLRDALRRDRGSGCALPRLDPFSADVAWYDRRVPPLRCGATDWVYCRHSKCRVVDAILASLEGVRCKYRDILYQDDYHFTWGPAWPVPGAGEYTLDASDFVKVSCSATNTSSGKRVTWAGNKLGLRRVVHTRAPERRARGLSVAIFAFDSTPRSGFIRLMPNTWRVINHELNATVMEGFNVVGDGTLHALFPLLTGHDELELPDVRRNGRSTRTLDDFPFIFRHLSDDGYRTAYLEDMPVDGTFDWRLNGFQRAPADHYLRAFRQANSHLFEEWNYCLGDKPMFAVLMNFTEQFLELDGKRFVFTLSTDITHADFSLIQWADDAAAAFLRRLLARREDTLIVVMGDHGPRYPEIRKTFSLRGKLDERLPLLALRLPDRLVRARPSARRALRHNARALVTAFDLHATLLDVVGLRQHWNPYRVEGADLLRGLTLLEPIPRNRSCSEAGIEAHWCSCLEWQDVSATDPLFRRSAQALVDHINRLLEDAGSLCARRSLTAAPVVLRQRVNKRLLTFKSALDEDTYLPSFSAHTKMTSETFQVGIEAGPGHALYEATLTYHADKDRFLVQARDISRVNAYSGESDCIAVAHPHLAPYCYCRG